MMAHWAVALLGTVLAPMLSRAVKRRGTRYAIGRAMLDRDHRFVRLAMGAVLTVLCSNSSAYAQSWPTRPITMVVPFAAGSASDTAGRVLAAGLSEVLGQQVIIENVAGAGSMTGTARVAQA